MIDFLTHSGTNSYACLFVTDNKTLFDHKGKYAQQHAWKFLILNKVNVNANSAVQTLI